AGVIGVARPAGAPPVWLGAVKSNIGHLEPASGAASLIKAVLSLYHGEIPPNLHFHQPNPKVVLEPVFRVPTTRQPWSAGAGRTRRASVHSYAASGTNAHLVLEEAPSLATREDSFERPWHVLALSARSEPALRVLAARYEQHLASHPEQSLADICYTANTGRSHFPYRLAIPADSPAVVRRRLQAVAAEQAPLPPGLPAPELPPPVVLVLAGGDSALVSQAAQWLYETQPTFRVAWEEAATACRPHLPHPLRPDARLSADPPVYEAALCFALAYALACLWRSWGVVPAVVLSHGPGQQAAAAVFGGETLAVCASQALAAGTALPPGPESEVVVLDLRPSDAGNFLGGRMPLATAVAALTGQGASLFLSISVLPEMNGAPGETAVWLPSLKAGEDAWQSLTQTLAALYTAGVTVDWTGFDRGYGRARLHMPTYPFERQRYWIATPAESAARPQNGREEARTGDAAQQQWLPYLQAEAARALQIPAEELPPDQPLDALFLDSLCAMAFKERVERELEVSLPVQLLAQGPSLIQLANFVAGRVKGNGAPVQASLVATAPTQVAALAAADSALFPLQPHGPRAPFFCVAPGYADLMGYRYLARLLGPEQPFYALQPPASVIGKEANTTELAARYLAEVRQVQASGPYFLGGYSSGGTLAFEMARQLRQSGELVARLILLDTLYRITWLDYLVYGGVERLIVLSRFLERAGRGNAASWKAVLQATFADEGLKVHLQAIRDYRPGPYPGAVTLFIGRRSLTRFNRTRRQWRSVIGAGLDVQWVPGTHYELLREPYVSALAQKLEACLRPAQI
ncbi:MAG: thioesterase domain-containing protein, partial [Chloroflexi bacterium]|nr:thioesterase domain-containing protein [Chloroflexota bacterium]